MTTRGKRQDRFGDDQWATFGMWLGETLPLDAAEFREAVKSCASHADMMVLIEREIFDRDPYAFTSELDLYSNVRTHLEQELGAEAGSVGLVGSAALGFSIAPENFTRALLPSSDLDFIVLSPELFDRAWNVLLRWGHPVRNRIPKEAQSWFDARSGEVFWGWLDPERLHFRGVTRPSLLKDLRRLQNTWFDTFQGLSKTFPGTQIATRHVSARLYRSRMHLLHYQANGLMKMRMRLQKEES